METIISCGDCVKNSFSGVVDGAYEPSVFISYRRFDTSGEAGRIADRLSNHFGDSEVFLDVKFIRIGRC